MPFTTTSLAKARAYAERMQGRMTKLREHAETAIEQGMEVAEVSGVSFAFGYANARTSGGEPHGELKVLGVPVDLSVGITLTAVAMMGGLGKYASHGVNLGSGALAAYGYRAGAKMGAQAALLAGNAAAKPTSYNPAFYAQPEPPAVTSGEAEVGYDDEYRTYTVNEPVAR